MQTHPDNHRLLSAPKQHTDQKQEGWEKPRKRRKAAHSSPRERTLRIQRENFCNFNYRTDPSDDFYPDAVSSHNTLKAKMIGCKWGLRLDKDILPLRQLKVLLGEYTIILDYLDAVEPIFEIYIDPYTEQYYLQDTTKLSQLDLQTDGVTTIKNRLAQHATTRSDNTHRVKIVRRL